MSLEDGDDAFELECTKCGTLIADLPPPPKRFDTGYDNSKKLRPATPILRILVWAFAAPVIALSVFGGTAQATFGIFVIAFSVDALLRACGDT